MKKYNTVLCGLLLFLFNFVVVISVYAGDGQIDFLPDGKTTFNIDKQGYYVLSGNVTMTANVPCISIMRENVTIDLNGHTIKGTGTSISAHGISCGTYSSISIINGQIESFGGYGIYSVLNIIVRKVSVSSNGGYGIVAGAESEISDVTAKGNKQYGIAVGGKSLIMRCKAINNNSDGNYAGINTGDDCIISDCIVQGNDYSSGTKKDVYGIKAGIRCTIMRNNCSNNQNLSSGTASSLRAIECGDGCIVKDNVCGGNKVSSPSGVLYGILTGAASTITGNTCSSNQVTGNSAFLNGIECGASCVVTGNDTSSNSTNGSGNNIRGMNIAGQYSSVSENNASNNTAGASSVAIGIRVQAGNCRVEKNHCTNNTGTVGTYGIFINTQLQGCTVISNTTVANTSGGISMGSNLHYCAENMTKESTGITSTTNVTLGSGDRSNISY